MKPKLAQFHADRRKQRDYALSLYKDREKISYLTERDALIPYSQLQDRYKPPATWRCWLEWLGKFKSK